MSHKLISHNPDLKKLRDEGYEIEIKGGFLLLHRVPYVNSVKEIAYGTLVSALTLAGDRTTRPQDHMAYFSGDHPCTHDGKILTGIQHSSHRTTLTQGVEVDFSFSNKPANGYPDHYEKVVGYVRIIEAHAQAIDPSVSAKTFKAIEATDPDIVFHYIDTNSSRAEIETIAAKVAELKVAIVGLGGTGSYVLDLVAKTQVREIHLFDGDSFLSHNAFRAPGAAPLEVLQRQPTKVSYLQGVYSKMHKYIIPHEYHVSPSVAEELYSMHFIFICIDEGAAKKDLVHRLVEKQIPFIDVGIGINVVDERLNGSVRVTTVTAKKNDHLATRIAFADTGNDEYNQNIQIAEINALNAALAVIKWKKLFRVYHDLEKEHHMAYDITVNKLINDENLA